MAQKYKILVDMDIGDDIDDAIAIIEAHRYRKLYSNDSALTVVQNAQGIWSAFKNQLSSTTLNDVINNLLSLVLYDGKYLFRFDGVVNGGADLLTFTAHEGFGQTFKLFSINIHLSSSITGNPSVTSVTGGKIEFGATNHTVDDYTIDTLNAYVIGGTYAPRYI